MKTFHRLNILDDAGSHRAVQQTLFGGSSLEGVSPHQIIFLGSLYFVPVRTAGTGILAHSLPAN